MAYDDPSAFTTETPKEKPLPTATEVRRMWDEGTQRRRTADQEAKTNLAFIAGDHYAVFDPVSQKFIKPVADGKVRLKVNHIQTLWRGEVSILTEGKPIPEVVPATAEEGDRDAANAGNRILDHELDRLDFETRRQELAGWLSAAGSAFLHPCWDPEAGTPMETVDELTGEVSVVPQGEVTLEVIPHFEMVVDPAARTSTKEARWAIHGRVMTKEEAFDKFGQEFKADASVAAYSTMLLQSGQAATDGKQSEGVLVLRLWYRPCRKYPAGFVITVVNDKVVETIQQYPYEHGELPFVDIHHIRVPGRYLGQSMLTQLIPLQKDYNQSRSRQAEIRALLSAPKFLAAEGQLDVDRMTTVPGEVVTFRPMGPYRPEPMQIPNMPSFLFQDAQQAYQEMQDIAGQHEVSKGQTPSSGIPAAGIIALQEKDERKIATTLRALEHGTARAGRQILSLVRQYWAAPRLVRVWSEKTSSSSIATFTGADLQGSLDVRVVPGSATPRSKTQQRQDYLSLWDRRVIDDPRMLMSMLELPNVGAVLEVFDKDARQAKREHDRILQGMGDMVTVEDWHSHDIHITEHNDFRKTEVFEGWPMEAMAMLSDHVRQHEQMRLQKLQQLAMEQMLMQPPAPGGEAAGPMPGPAPAEAIPGVNAPLDDQVQALTNQAVAQSQD